MPPTHLLSDDEIQDFFFFFGSLFVLRIRTVKSHKPLFSKITHILFSDIHLGMYFLFVSILRFVFLFLERGCK